ncbi:MAG: Phosphohydrolase [Bryobacterales bacterium]|jgi:predicted NUDIX family NTP pyrophosphohydrolase|nr:Phosphohydrolase [Bryobacterales bacterium]
MPKRSAGVLLFRRKGSAPEVLLAHPGGPFWKNKEDGAWSIPKGEYGENEDPLAAAKREFAEETGVTLSGNFIPLGEIRQGGGKVVMAWAMEGDLDAANIHSNTFSMPWPPGSGKLQEFPEIDRAEWFNLDVARRKILKGQAELLERLGEHLQRN